MRCLALPFARALVLYAFVCTAASLDDQVGLGGATGKKALMRREGRKEVSSTEHEAEEKVCKDQHDVHGAWCDQFCTKEHSLLLQTRQSLFNGLCPPEYEVDSAALQVRFYAPEDSNYTSVQISDIDASGDCDPHYEIVGDLCENYCVAEHIVTTIEMDLSVRPGKCADKNFTKYIGQENTRVFTYQSPWTSTTTTSGAMMHLGVVWEVDPTVMGFKPPVPPVCTFEHEEHNSGKWCDQFCRRAETTIVSRPALTPGNCPDRFDTDFGIIWIRLFVQDSSGLESVGTITMDTPDDQLEEFCNPHYQIRGGFCENFCIPAAYISTFVDELGVESGKCADQGHPRYVGYERTHAFQLTEPYTPPAALWFCVVRKYGDVLGPFANVSEAKTVLNTEQGKSTNPQMVCEMTRDNGALNDMTTVGGELQGDGTGTETTEFNSYWASLSEMQAMRDMCNNNAECKSNAGAADAVAAVVAEADAEIPPIPNIDGSWVASDGTGATIAGTEVTWEDGISRTATDRTNTSIVIWIQGECYAAEFAVGNLYWSDGDVWERPAVEADTPNCGDCAADDTECQADCLTEGGAADAAAANLIASAAGRAWAAAKAAAPVIAPAAGKPVFKRLQHKHRRLEEG